MKVLLCEKYKMSTLSIAAQNKIVPFSLFVYYTATSAKTRLAEIFQKDLAQITWSNTGPLWLDFHRFKMSTDVPYEVITTES